MSHAKEGSSFFTLPTAFKAVIISPGNGRNSVAACQGSKTLPRNRPLSITEISSQSPFCGSLVLAILNSLAAEGRNASVVLYPLSGDDPGRLYLLQDPGGTMTTMSLGRPRCKN